MVYSGSDRLPADFGALSALRRRRRPALQRPLEQQGARGEDYVVIGIEIPTDLAIEGVGRGDPARWDLAHTREAGDRWVELGLTAVLQVPSKVIPVEANYLLNTAHPDFARLRIANPEPFRFEERLLDRWVGIR